MSDTFSYPAEFQVEILRFLLKDAENFRKYSDKIQIPYFTEYLLQDIFYLTKLFFADYREIPTKAVLINLIDVHIKNTKKPLNDYITCLEQIYISNVSNVEYIRKETIKFIKIQALRQAVQKAATNLENGDFVLNLIEKAVRSTNELEFDIGYIYKTEVHNRFELFKSCRIKNQIPTFSEQINKNTDGGLGAGELGCIVAPPNSAKSIFLVNLASSAIQQGKNVVYFTMEMHDASIAKRVDGCLCRYNKGEILKKADKVQGRVESVPGNLIIRFYRANQANITDFTNYILNLKSNYGFSTDLILVDSLELMRYSERVKEERHRIKRICEDLRDIGATFEVPVWSVHQANIFNEGKEEVKTIKGKHVSEAKIGILGTCDYVASLNQTLTETVRYPETIRFYVIRNRDGDKDKEFRMLIDKPRFFIIDDPAYLRTL
jgi:replicative DNA helicase